MRLIQKVQALMDSNNVSRLKVYRDTGLSDKAISNWMRGKSAPTIGAIKVLADYFGLTLAEFFEGVDEV